MISISLPAQLGVDFEIAGNSIRQLFRPGFTGNITGRTEHIGKKEAWVATRSDGSEVLIVNRSVPVNSFAGDVLRIKTSVLSGALASDEPRHWVKTVLPPGIAAATPSEAASCVQAVLDSWKGNFFYLQENAATQQPGLRPPQLGALFATLAHWTVAKEEAATIAMPTGTGKTETMLALMVDQRCPCILVVVPTNALREQIAEKFLTLGILKQAGVVGGQALYPVVGMVEHRFEDVNQVENFLRSCNVVVATMQAINSCSEDVRRKISEHCSHLMIDEAHHVKASSWDSFRRRFHNKPIIQFTATPFRNDGQHIGGRMIYNYPLRKAQQENYFKPIQFRPIYAYVDSDRKIAEKALEQLEQDLAAGLNHLVMARVNTIARAEQVHKIYEELAPQHLPLCIHSEISAGARRDAVKRLREAQSRIIVCVDMLGEGFDLPQLKIAALHDIHKSLAITLQFTGRFTRTMSGDGSRIGDATMIANRALSEVNAKIRALYAEDADWNKIIRELGEGATEEEAQRSDFQRTFGSSLGEVPIQNLAPKMSTVVYRTDCEAWEPEALEDLFPEEMRYTKEFARSEQHHVMWFVTKETSEIGWADLRELEDVTYHLYLLHWDESQNLLFINSSNNGSLHDEIAKAVCGETAAIIRGGEVYRAMHNINRMVPTNLGLLDAVSRTRRFMMLMGADTTEGLEPSQSRTKTKTNLFGFGFENGERVSIGCSLKGRIWSYLVAYSLSDWVNWCRHVGAKLIDESINTDDIFQYFIKPIHVRERPDLVPLAVEWPLAFLAEQEHRIAVKIEEEEVLFFEAGLEIVEHTRDRPIRFRIVTEHQSAEYQVSFSDEGTRYLPQGDEALIRIGKRVKPASEWFRQFAPKIHFEQDTFIEHDLLLQMQRDIAPFDAARIEAWDWVGIDIKKESQRAERRRDSVQFRTIERVLASNADWDVVFDDDDAGEIADVVAMRMDNNRLIVHLYHCKFSGEENSGSRVEDFYAVCGQAQKSVHWREQTGLSEIIPHLIRREQQRLNKGEATRFEKGDFQMLEQIGQRREVLRPEFKVFVVQPGLSKAGASRPVLELLSATSLYLFETFNIEFGVISSS